MSYCGWPHSLLSSLATELLLLLCFHFPSLLIRSMEALRQYKLDLFKYTFLLPRNDFHFTLEITLLET